MRIHVVQGRMTYEEADTLYYFLNTQRFVTSVKVYEWVNDAVICYQGNRENIIELLKKFQYRTAEVPESFLQNSGRALNDQYWEKLVTKVVLRTGNKWFLPYPIRSVINDIETFSCALKLAMPIAVLSAIREASLFGRTLPSFHGISTTIEGKKAVIGSHHFVFEDENCTVPSGMEEQFDLLPAQYSNLYLAIENELAAVICIEERWLIRQAIQQYLHIVPVRQRILPLRI